MLLKTLIRKLKSEKKVFVVLIIFILIGTGFNFSISVIGSMLKNFNSFLSQGDTVVVARNATLENISRYGEVVDYQYYDPAIMKYGGKEIRVFNGYGEFKTLGIKSPGRGKAIVLGMDIPIGALITINGKNYTVAASYFYITSSPMVLTQHRGKTLFVFMKCKDSTALSQYLRENAQILQFNTWEGENGPGYQNIKQAENFVLALFSIVILSTLLIILLLGITHVIGELRATGILKAIGMPDSFITSLFMGNYLLLSLIGYLAGILFGIFLGMQLSENLVSLPFKLNASFLMLYNSFIFLAIVIFALLPHLYVRRVDIITALRGGFSRISSLKYFILFFIIFFAILAPFTVAQEFSTQKIEVPFDLYVYGDVGNLSIGEKAGYLYGVKFKNTYTDIYFMDYNSSFASTVMKGKWFSRSGEAVIGYGLAERYNLHVGDKIRIRMLGKWDNYTLVGISNSPLNNYEAVYLPKVKYIPDSVAFIKTSEPGKLEKQLESEGFVVETEEDIAREFRNEVSMLNTLLSSLFISLLIVSVLSLFTMLYLDIKKNEKVYATLKAMGIPNSHVYREFFPLIALSSITGLLLSTPLAILTGTKIFGMILPSHWSSSVILYVILFGMGILGMFLIFAAILLGRIMNKMDVISSLRT